MITTEERKIVFDLRQRRASGHFRMAMYTIGALAQNVVEICFVVLCFMGHSRNLMITQAYYVKKFKDVLLAMSQKVQTVKYGYGIKK